jgi:hypothetical protein
MSSGIVQISACVGCAGVALRYIIQLLIVLWSFKDDQERRRHAVRLLLALRGKRLEHK